MRFSLCIFELHVATQLQLFNFCIYSSQQLRMIFYRVFHGFRRNLDQRCKLNIFGPLLNSFGMSCIFLRQLRQIQIKDPFKLAFPNHWCTLYFLPEGKKPNCGQINEQKSWRKIFKSEFCLKKTCVCLFVWILSRSVYNFLNSNGIDSMKKLQ